MASRMTVLGIIADTHIPERVRQLNPTIMPIFKEAQVDVILHAGDVCVSAVLQQLEHIAPVQAVRGNRDWVNLSHLPFSRFLNFNGVTIALAHGHGRLREYLVDKVHYAFYGMEVERYQKRLIKEYTQVNVIVYGHLHVPYNQWVDGQLLFNPGSACCPAKDYTSSVGLLRIQAGGEVEGQIVELC